MAVWCDRERQKGSDRFDRINIYRIYDAYEYAVDSRASHDRSYPRMADGKELAAAFGAVVREARKERGFSQEGFADHVGVHRTFMGLIERGKTVVTIATAQRVALGLGLTLSQLFGKVESQTGGEVGT